MTVEQWINGIKNINSYLPLMQQYTRAFSEEDLITEVITANIPSTWNKDYRLANLHLKMQIKHIIGALTIIEEHVKIQPSANSNANKKNSRIPAESIMEATSGMTAIKTLKMQRAMGKITRQAMVKAKMRTMVILENKDAPKAVAFNLEHLLMATAVAKQEAHPIVKSYKYNCINEKKSERENTEQTPSSEILVNLPNTKNSKKYTTYIGLVDSGSSGSLLNSSIIENDFSVEKQKNPTKWDTATGVLLTKGKVFIEALSLPQFTRQRKVSTTFYLFEKRKDDKYDIIPRRDFLQAIGLDIHYSASQFTWDNILVTMVPSGYWTKEKIKSITKTWNKPIKEAVNKMHLTKILPAEYKPVDNVEVVEKQTHLLAAEREQLKHVLLDFQDLFNSNAGKIMETQSFLNLSQGQNPQN